MELVPLWLRWVIVVGLVLAGCVAAVTAKDHYDERRRDEGRSEVRAEVALRDRKAAEDELAKAQANGRETVRRIERQGESHDAGAAALAAVVADRAVARSEQRLLDDHVAALESIARGAAASDSAAVASRQAADDATRMLAQLQRWADERSGILADFADAAHIAGATCQRDYEALTP